MSKVFLNDEIFTSDRDYVIGGFETDKVTGYNYADFFSALQERISDLLKEFIQETILIETEKGTENPEEKAYNDVSLIIADNLGEYPEFYDLNSCIQTILRNDKIQSWLLQIKENVKNYDSTNLGIENSIYNRASRMSDMSLEYQNAEHWTKTTTFTQFIEEVSSIEL